jgi:hypothetical protein
MRRTNMRLRSGGIAGNGGEKRGQERIRDKQKAAE